MQPAPQTAMPAARAVAASRARRVTGGPGALVRVLAGQLVRAAEQHRGAVAPARRQGQLLLNGRVGHGQQDQVHRRGQVGQGRVAGPPGDLLVPGVDQVHVGPRRAPGDLADHPLAQAARPGLAPTRATLRASSIAVTAQVGSAQPGAGWSSAAGCGLGLDGRPGAGWAAPVRGRASSSDAGRRPGPRYRPRRSPEDRGPGWRHRRRSWCSLRAVRAGHARRVSWRACPARLALFWSAIAARAACQPGIPHTPPPACVAELP